MSTVMVVEREKNMSKKSFAVPQLVQHSNITSGRSAKKMTVSCWCCPFHQLFSAG